MNTYPKIEFSITTYKRLDLFLKTMESFLDCCMDRDLITHFIVGDDGSNPNDLRIMKNKFPFLEIHKNPKKGQASNLNNLFDKIQSEYFFHCEDDWLFIKQGHFIREMFDVSWDNPLIKNVTLRDWRNKTIQCKNNLHLRYNLHEYNPEKAYDKDGRLNYNVVKITNCEWFGYSLGVSLQHSPTVKEIGKYDENFVISSRWWDRPPAERYLKLGYKAANLISGPWVRHIGEHNSAYQFRLEGK